MDKKVNIELTHDEALVLFDFLSRFNKSDNNINFEHDAEQKLFWILETQLENLLSEPFQKNYKEIVFLAREKVNKNY